MSKFGSSSNKKEVPQASSNSLSDIVFMLLFFFMVTTQMRETENKVKVVMPQASEVAKLERKDLSVVINIGSPTKQYQALFGTDARIQLNDAFRELPDIRDFIAAERDAMSEAEQSLMTVNLRVDQDVRMGIVSDVKQELRRCSALRIMYAARRPAQ
ncbi:MAG: biopolymer transporter ExbD [Bacteroidales bacterium]|nr:biopolymer transporter ExbD [Bacteroidales bacterium]